MQRLLRDEGYALADPQQPAQCQAMIHRHCPPSIGNLFAIAREGRSGGLEWWTELPGQPQHFEAISPAEQARLKERLNQRLAALGSLVEELARRGDAAVDTLRALPTQPGEDTLYSVGGDPVLIRWAPVRSLAAPAPVASAASAAAAPPPPPVAPSKRRRWVVPVMLPLLLGGLALLGLWLGLQHGRFALPWPSGQDEVVPIACRNDATPAPEFVTIFDTSGSMNLHISASFEDELWFFGMSDLGRALRAGDPRMQRLAAHPSRLDVAQDAFAELVRDIDPTVDIGLITYRGCEAPIVQGMFTADQRPRLVAGIRALEANDGTPLAASLQQAAAMVDGKERDAVILAFVDGADGCEQNQCAIARDIASQQPRLRVNVVDISNSGLSDCIADETGGRVFGSKDADAIAAMLKDAGREALSAAHCPG